MLDGVVALISLADEAKPFQPIDRYVKIAIDNTTVTVTVTFPVADLLKLVKSHKP